jgi:hypothetical protein
MSNIQTFLLGVMVALTPGMLFLAYVILKLPAERLDSPPQRLTPRHPPLCTAPPRESDCSPT